MEEKLTTETIRLAKIAADLDKQLQIAASIIANDYGICAMGSMGDCNSHGDCTECWRELIRRKAAEK